MKTWNQCHIKKSEVEFTKGKAVCKSCRASIIKAERTQAKLTTCRILQRGNRKWQQLPYTHTQYEKLRKNPKRFNITPMKDWHFPVNSMYKERYRDMFKKGILRDIIVLDAIHENNDINMEIKFIVNSLATELLGIKPVKIDIPIIHIMIDAGGLCLLYYATEIKTLTVCPAIYKMVIFMIMVPPYTCSRCAVKTSKSAKATYGTPYF